MGEQGRAGEERNRSRDKFLDDWRSRFLEEISEVD